MAGHSAAAMMAGWVAGAITLIFKASASSSPASATHTYVGATLSTTGHTVVCIAHRNASNTTISSVTVDGTAATNAISTTSGDGTGAGIWVAAATGNATGTITIVFSASTARSGMATYGMVGAGSATPTATATDIASPISQSLTINTGGCGIAAYMSTDTATMTWGGTGVVEDVDAQVDAQLYSFSSNITAGTPTWTATPSSGPGSPACVFAAFGP